MFAAEVVAQDRRPGGLRVFEAAHTQVQRALERDPMEERLPRIVRHRQAQPAGLLDKMPVGRGVGLSERLDEAGAPLVQLGQQAVDRLPAVDGGREAREGVVHRSVGERPALEHRPRVEDLRAGELARPTRQPAQRSERTADVAHLRDPPRDEAREGARDAVLPGPEQVREMRMAIEEAGERVPPGAVDHPRARRNGEVLPDRGDRVRQDEDVGRRGELPGARIEEAGPADEDRWSRGRFRGIGGRHRRRARRRQKQTHGQRQRSRQEAGPRTPPRLDQPHRRDLAPPMHRPSRPRPTSGRPVCSGQSDAGEARGVAAGRQGVSADRGFRTRSGAERRHPGEG